ncbi:MAG: MrcB family domain-containing protein [Methanobacterium sp.]
MLKENIEKIFKNYLNSRNESFANHPIAAVLRNDLPKDLESLTENPNKYKFAGSAGQGNWTHSPWVAVFNKKITESAQRGYYIVYLFREDMKGVYLSLNQGMTDIRNQTSSNVETKEILRSQASDFRHKLQGNLLDNFLDEIDLGVINSPNAPFYEAGNIIAKYYSAENLPSEDVFESDFRDFLLIYDLLAGENLLTIIEDVNVIEDAQNMFIDIIKKLSNKTVSAKAGFQGGQESGEVHWSDDLGIWLMTRKIKNSRYWNGFGIDEPSEDAGLTITAEINFPIKGIDRRIAGTFVTDGNEIYVAHRGKLGGNYSKKFFDENYHGKWTKIQDGDRESEVVLIGGLNDPKLPEKVSQFVFEVDRMKTGRTTPIISSKESFHVYLKEHGYMFSPEIIENFLLSLKVKPFVILTGNSGTGKTKLAQLFAQYLMRKEGNNENAIITKVKPNLSSIKYSAWTLDRSDLEPLHLDLEKNFDIKVGEIPAKAKLSMSPRLWYEDPDSKIKSMLENLANTDPDKEIELKLITESIDESNYEIVSVGANWTENRHLLGFHNVINSKYQTTPALNLILQASNDKTNPYFMILDEMNLSHVERYFADFLSAMESDEPIHLHKNDNLEIPQELEIPLNLLVLGTVNIDETTYMFSPKVLDRANTIEFSTYPAMNYMLSEQDTENPSGNIKYLENPLSDIKTRNFTINDLKEKFKDVKINSSDYLWEVLAGEINSFQLALGKAGFDFGFRVINEILRFMYVAWVYEGKQEVWDNWMRYFDAQVKQKMLPKLHGSQRVLEEVLRDLFELCYIDTVDSPPRYFEELSSDPSVKYVQSALKIQEMDKVLNEQRYVSFIN